MGPQLPPPKSGQTPNFWPIFIVAKRLDESRWHLAWRWGLGPSYIVLDGDPAPLPQKENVARDRRTDRHARPIYISRRLRPFLLSPYGCMHQDATWYGGRPRPRRHCVRWGPSYPQNRGHTHHHPVFGRCLLWPNGWVDEDATWYGSRPRPRPIVIDAVPALRETGTAAPHVFGRCLLLPRSPISATAELL